MIWKKNTFPPFTCGHFCKDKEICLVFWEKGKLNITGSWEEMKTVVEIPVNNKDKELYLHPTIKPLDEVKRRILTCKKHIQKDNFVVLDTFLGSGTTAVACKEIGVDYIGFERDEEYYNIALDRLNGMTVQDRKNKENGIMNIFDYLEEE